jgi:hypothetical protein
LVFRNTQAKEFGGTFQLLREPKADEVRSAICSILPEWSTFNYRSATSQCGEFTRVIGLVSGHDFTAW